MQNMLINYHNEATNTLFYFCNSYFRPILIISADKYFDKFPITCIIRSKAEKQLTLQQYSAPAHHVHTII